MSAAAAAASFSPAAFLLGSPSAGKVTANLGGMNEDDAYYCYISELGPHDLKYFRRCTNESIADASNISVDNAQGWSDEPRYKADDHPQLLGDEEGCLMAA